jgi:hypothetical protein
MDEDPIDPVLGRLHPLKGQPREKKAVWCTFVIRLNGYGKVKKTTLVP